MKKESLFYKWHTTSNDHNRSGSTCKHRFVQFIFLLYRVRSAVFVYRVPGPTIPRCPFASPPPTGHGRQPHSLAAAAVGPGRRLATAAQCTRSAQCFTVTASSHTVRHTATRARDTLISSKSYTRARAHTYTHTHRPRHTYTDIDEPHKALRGARTHKDTKTYRANRSWSPHTFSPLTLSPTLKRTQTCQYDGCDERICE